METKGFAIVLYRPLFGSQEDFMLEETMRRTTKVLTDSQYDYLKRRFRGAPERHQDLYSALQKELETVVTPGGAARILLFSEGTQCTKALAFEYFGENHWTLIAHFGFGNQDPLDLPFLEQFFLGGEEEELKGEKKDGYLLVWVLALIALTALALLVCSFFGWLWIPPFEVLQAISGLLVILCGGLALYLQRIYHEDFSVKFEDLRERKQHLRLTFASE